MKEIQFDDSNTQQAALQEGKIMSKVNYKYICRYYDTIIQKKRLYIVMEYCEKGDLGLFLSRMQV